MAYVIKNGKYKVYYGLQFFEAFPNHDLLEKDYNLVYRKEYKMTREEAKEFFDEQKRQGTSEHDILATLFSMFADDCIDEELEELVGILGYELNAKFKELSPKDKKTKKWWDPEGLNDDIFVSSDEDLDEYDKELYKILEEAIKDK